MPSTVTLLQDEPFLRKQQTLDALASFNSFDNVVIYCGAGVTIDQTGVSWSQLISEVFAVALGTKTGWLTRFKSVEFLLSALSDPRQAASLVSELFYQEKVSENDFLKSALFQILYTKGAWSTGQILRNVSLFAILATMFGRNVTIITTNYDAFIEADIKTRYEGLSANVVVGERSPGVFRTIYEPGKDERRVEIMEPAGNAGTIELIYLHGRVGGSGDGGGAGEAEGVLVLTEDSYARTRDQSRDVLVKHFERQADGTTKALLIVGASLTDGPLIDALALTHERKTPPGRKRQSRIALTDMPLSERDMAKPFESRIAGNDVTSTSVRDALALRGRHLGVEILWPASHSQTAQFLEELRVEDGARRRHGRDDAYTDEKLGLSYPQRLKRWETEFAKSPTMTDPAFVHDELATVVEAIKSKLRHEGYDQAEVLRLELWARSDPSSRQMTLVGNSVGPLFDQNALRREGLDQTGNASILALLEGRPLLKSIEALGLDPERNRWQTFFAVPIFLHVAADDNGGGRVPAGVLTLASTLSTEREIEGRFSCFRHLENPAFEFLKSDIMIPIGKGLLSPDHVETRWRNYLKRIDEKS